MKWILGAAAVGALLATRSAVLRGAAHRNQGRDERVPHTHL
ncbi:hypothetical protein [Alicyclobacillus vulcanalis]|uniref:Uncharacterized protein n=1 Tax=Alicyclobacillus vulcanalis TaxID=252246 RepID=A0A1N7PTD2_9BACL|nr:hypothetical protein [Alicyclobacillus vulcanalis]SIT13810.1 hypothetical protein SAMN05421799_1177 [Alicyclobacillus vulcanalis]